MTARPYHVSSLVLTGGTPGVPMEVRGETAFVALVSATVDATAVEVSIGATDTWEPLILGLAVVDLPKGTQRISIRSSTGQTVRVATGSAMVRDSRTAPGGTSSMSIVDLGGNGLGKELAAQSLSVCQPTDEQWKVIGAAANGAAVAGNPVRVGGSDGATTRDIKTDASGNLIAVGTVASGAAVSGNPLRIAGSDGANARDIKTDANGNLIAVGAVASGSAIGTTAPVMMAASDGTLVQRVSGVADNTATPAAGNLTGVTGLYNSAARALTSARVAFLSIDRGGKVLTFPCATLDPVLAGYTASILDAAATTNATNLKAAAGMVYEVSAVNNAAYDVFIRLYNKATAPTVGTDIAYRVIRVPAGQSVTVTFPGGAYFATGVGYATTKLVAYNDATALVLHDVQFTIQWA